MSWVAKCWFFAVDREFLLLSCMIIISYDMDPTMNQAL